MWTNRRGPMRLLQEVMALVTALSGLTPVPALAQTPPPEEPPPIQDNSFLIEEAYNQEPGVVQHISAYSRSEDGEDWVYTFTQEWPLGGQAHQIGFTLPVQAVEAGSSRRRGLGDVAVNYRWQALGNGAAPVAFAPRISLLLPTGDEGEGLGAGGWGVQANLPLSARAGRSIVTHWNLGDTYTPAAKDPAGNEVAIAGCNIGASLVWLARSRLNVLLETAWSRNETPAGPGLTVRSTELFVSPGVRWAFDLQSGLQIVPGLAAPIGAGPSRGDHRLFFYVSFEHPFGGEGQ